MLDDIRDTRPWFWILVAALAALGVVALVLAISAGNEGVDQKQAVAEATAQIEGEVSGLESSLAAANQIQEENDEGAAEARKQIQSEVDAAVAAGEGELQKVKRRVSSLEDDVATGAEEVEKLAKSDAALAAEQEALKKSNARIAREGDALEAEVGELAEGLAKLESSGK